MVSQDTCVPQIDQTRGSKRLSKEPSSPEPGLRSVIRSVILPSLFLIVLDSGDNVEEDFAEYCTGRTRNRVWHSHQ